MTETHLDRVRKQFTRTADVYAQMRQTTDERGLDAVVRLSGARRTDRVLDVACGPGFLTMAFAQHCAEATGLDATTAFITLARTEASARSLKNVYFKRGDAERLPFSNETFETVSCRAAFHHFPKPAKVLAEMARVATPAGRIVVADQLGSENVEQAELHNRIERLCDSTHVTALPQSEFARLFSGADLTISHQIHTTIDYDLEEWITHGAPTRSARAEIISLMESNLENDRAGLCVRRVDGRILFSHKAAAFVLEKA